MDVRTPVMLTRWPLQGSCPLLPVSSWLTRTLMGSGLAYAWPLPPPHTAAMAWEGDVLCCPVKHAWSGVKLSCRVSLLLDGALREKLQDAVEALPRSCWSGATLSE